MQQIDKEVVVYAIGKVLSVLRSDYTDTNMILYYEIIHLCQCMYSYYLVYNVQYYASKDLQMLSPYIMLKVLRL
jgi:hypothetical protein